MAHKKYYDWIYVETAPKGSANVCNVQGMLTCFFVCTKSETKNKGDNSLAAQLSMFSIFFALDFDTLNTEHTKWSKWKAMRLQMHTKKGSGHAVWMSIET